jgi:hypothetical protein
VYFVLEMGVSLTFSRAGLELPSFLTPISQVAGIIDRHETLHLTYYEDKNDSNRCGLCIV